MTRQKLIWWTVGVFAAWYLLQNPDHAGTLVGSAVHWVTHTAAPALATFLNRV